MAGQPLTSIELCAGAGGQAVGLEAAGFDHQALVEWERPACETLRRNRPGWNVIEGDLTAWDPSPYVGVDLVAGGVPCPPFSHAGRQLGADDERNLFPAAIDIVDAVRPRAVLLENVRGLLDDVFATFRRDVDRKLRKLNYVTSWRLLNASDFGVSQLRPRVVLVAIENVSSDHFDWPAPSRIAPKTVGELLRDPMAANGWRGADAWAAAANSIAPTLVGGSKKHGGPDLGPTRARRAWAALGVEGRSLANEAPPPDFDGMPRLTVRMAARVQGFDDSWAISGRKTAAYRQVGNAFPPPVAAAVGAKVAQALATRRLIAVAS